MNPKNVSIDIRRCRCHAYQDVLKSMGFTLTPDNPIANIVWWDGSIPVEEFNSIRPEQHVNKIPKMDYLCYKSVLFNTLNQMQSLYPFYYDFFPKTYLLPQQFQDFQKEHQKSIARNESNFLRSRNRHSNFLSFRMGRAKTINFENANKNLKSDDKKKENENNEKESDTISTSESAPAPTIPSDLPSINLDEPELPTWIVKPRSGCCGTGIKLIQNSFELAHDSTPSVVQKYVHPFLIDDHKFDFRFYLLITDLQPLSLFIYNEGIARFCTEKYEPPTRKNLNDKFIHITNTAINVENKNLANDKFEFTRLASDVLKSIEKINPKKGGEVLWSKIKRISILTILALYPKIMSSIKSVCGEVIIDEDNNDSICNINTISRNKRKSSVNNEKPLTANSRRSTRNASVNPSLFYQSKTMAATTNIKTIKAPETPSSSLIRPSINHQLSIKNQNNDNIKVQSESNKSENNDNSKQTEKTEELQQQQNIGEETNKVSNENNDKDKKATTIVESQKSSDDDEKPAEKEFFISRSPAHRFFHLLGIDIMIDENCNPIVLELNDNPSMKITFPLEKKLKPQLLRDEMSIVTLDGSHVSQKTIEKTGWNVLISPPSQNENQTNDDNTVLEDKHLNSLIRSIQQRSMNIFGPSTFTKRNQRANIKTVSAKSRYNAQQNNNSNINSQSSLSQNSVSTESDSKGENKTNKKLEPIAQPISQKQNTTVPMAASSSKVTRSIIHPKIKYSATTEKTAKFRRTGYPKYYYQ